MSVGADCGLDGWRAASYEPQGHGPLSNRAPTPEYGRTQTIGTHTKLLISVPTSIDNSTHYSFIGLAARVTLQLRFLRVFRWIWITKWRMSEIPITKLVWEREREENGAGAMESCVKLYAWINHTILMLIFQIFWKFNQISDYFMGKWVHQPYLL